MFKYISIQEMCVFRFKFHRILFPILDLKKKVSIGLGYGLAPNRRQAITWLNDHPSQWRIYEFRPKYAVFWFKMYSTDHSEMLHTSR